MGLFGVLVKGKVELEFSGVPETVQCSHRETTDISGQLVITINEPVHISFCGVWLRGYTLSNPLWWVRDDRVVLSNFPHLQQRVPQRRNITDRQVHLNRFIPIPLLDLDEQRRILPESLYIVQHHPGLIRKSFRFTINGTFPDSWDGNKDANACVRYYLAAMVNYIRPEAQWPSSPTKQHYAVKFFNLTVKNSFSLSELSPENPYLHNPVLSIETSRVEVRDLLCRRGSITFSLILPYLGFIHGEEIPISVEIDNSNSSIRMKSAFLALVETMTISSRKVDERVVVEEVELSKVQVKNVLQRGVLDNLVSLRVPIDCRTDRSFRNNLLIRHKFAVRLMLNFWCHKTLTVEVPCHVGSTRSDRPIIRPHCNRHDFIAGQPMTHRRPGSARPAERRRNPPLARNNPIEGERSNDRAGPSAGERSDDRARPVAGERSDFRARPDAGEISDNGGRPVTEERRNAPHDGARHNAGERSDDRARPDVRERRDEPQARARSPATPPLPSPDSFRSIYPDRTPSPTPSADNMP